MDHAHAGPGDADGLHRRRCASAKRGHNPSGRKRSGRGAGIEPGRSARRGADRGQSRTAGFEFGHVPRRHYRTATAPLRTDRLRPRAALRLRHVREAQEAARAQVDARDLGADLRDLQDLSADAGQVHPAARALHRRRSWSSTSACCGTYGDHASLDHPDLQPGRHRRQLRRGLVRHPRQHVRQLAHRVRRRCAASRPDVRHPARRPACRSACC